jgi:polyhydroxyalkanoate synthesis regulator phasin
MTENIENLIIEILKKIQTEQGAARDRDMEIVSRLSNIEEGVARIARYETSNYSDIVHDRHIVDILKERVDRIERRLELSAYPKIIV